MYMWHCALINYLYVFSNDFNIWLYIYIYIFNYSTIKKEILSIVLCISKFQSDLLNQKFLVRIDCKSAKHVLEKDVQNIASKQIFARWQAILSVFDFDLYIYIYIKWFFICLENYIGYFEWNCEIKLVLCLTLRCVFCIITY